MLSAGRSTPRRSTIRTGRGLRAAFNLVFAAVPSRVRARRRALGECRPDATKEEIAEAPCSGFPRSSSSARAHRVWAADGARAKNDINLQRIQDVSVSSSLAVGCVPRHAAGPARRQNRRVPASPRGPRFGLYPCRLSRRAPRRRPRRRRRARRRARTRPASTRGGSGARRFPLSSTTSRGGEAHGLRSSRG